VVGVIADSEQRRRHGASARAGDPLYPPPYARLLEHLEGQGPGENMGSVC